MELDEDSVDLIFHGTAYNLSVTVQHVPETSASLGSSQIRTAEPQGLLAIDLEELATGADYLAQDGGPVAHRTRGGSPFGSCSHWPFSASFVCAGVSWHAEFTAAYIENITSKTGSFKKFSVLVKMLLGALRQQTETVFLDLLTFSDLVSVHCVAAVAVPPVTGAWRWDITCTVVGPISPNRMRFAP
jgi:hypothetical protein